MTTAVDEACTGNFYLMRGYFWCGKLAFCCWAGYSSHLHGLLQMVGLREGVG